MTTKTTVNPGKYGNVSQRGKHLSRTEWSAVFTFYFPQIVQSRAEIPDLKSNLLPKVLTTSCGLP